MKILDTLETAKLKNVDDFYLLNKAEQKEFLNTWNKSNIKRNIDEYGVKQLAHLYITTYKRVDAETKRHLCGTVYNPLHIYIRYDMLNSSYMMKVHLSSRDDASFGIWQTRLNLSECEEMTNKVIDYVSNLDVINGMELLNNCITFGFDPNEKDFN